MKRVIPYASKTVKAPKGAPSWQVEGAPGVKRGKRQSVRPFTVMVNTLVVLGAGTTQPKSTPMLL